VKAESSKVEEMKWGTQFLMGDVGAFAALIANIFQIFRS
jgi:hypothetical protein